jgi:dienelactone hydrolase
VRETAAKDAFEGTFYAPAAARRRPAVLVIGGSEGGPGSSWLGERLAANGIPALVIGYFHAPGLPDKLVDIPLEYFRTALDWLDGRPEVDAKRVSLLGASYGSEAALLLGVHYPGLVHGVAALVPSSVVTCGIIGADRAGSVSRCLGSPWRLAGRPLPHTAVLNNPRPWDAPRAVIPVERIQAPVFLACGGHDQVWSSCPYARAIVARRSAHGESTLLFVYPNASHGVGRSSIYEPGADATDFFVPADERAREDLWPRLLAFLHAA